MALVTLQEYKDYYSINSTTNDTRLNLLVDLVSELVETYVSREIDSTTYTNKAFELLGNYVYLDNFPVTTLTTLEYLHRDSKTWIVIPSEDYYLEGDNGVLEILDPETTVLVAADRNKAIRATYEGGYLTVPSDLKLAIFDLITYYNKREQTPVRSVQGQNIDNSAGINGSEMPPHIKRVLSLYRVPA